MLPDLDNLESHLSTLETLAKKYRKSSPERAAIFAAAHALRYVQDLDTKAKFQAWVDGWTQPPTALQVLHAKLAGIKVPHELLDEILQEVEQIFERLRHLRQ